jgi:ribosomal subunit interface protein
MDMTFTGRGLQVTDTIRGLAEQKLAPLGRIEPRATALDLEVINEHHPRLDGLKRVEASLRIPRKTFRAHAEAEDVSTAIDRVRDKLERQLRDHHGRKRPVHDKGALGYAPAADAEAGAVPEAELGDTGWPTGRSAG